MVGRKFGRKRKKVTGGWRRLHDEEPSKSHLSPNIGRVINIRRMKWLEPLASMEKKKV
jgi:hypothetical protein